jgi:hypothetical protein
VRISKSSLQESAGITVKGDQSDGSCGSIPAGGCQTPNTVSVVLPKVSTVNTPFATGEYLYQTDPYPCSVGPTHKKYGSDAAVVSSMLSPESEYGKGGFTFLCMYHGSFIDWTSKEAACTDFV